MPSSAVNDQRTVHTVQVEKADSGTVQDDENAAAAKSSMSELVNSIRTSLAQVLTAKRQQQALKRHTKRTRQLDSMDALKRSSFSGSTEATSSAPSSPARPSGKMAERLSHRVAPSQCKVTRGYSMSMDV